MLDKIPDKIRVCPDKCLLNFIVIEGNHYVVHIKFNHIL